MTTYRLIDRQTAEWIGMAASVAGGWIAVDLHLGVIGEIDADSYPEDATGRYIPDRDPSGDEIRLHPLPNGDLVGHGPATPRTRLLMCVPDDAGLATEGEAAPASLIADLRPTLESAGYAVD